MKHFLAILFLLAILLAPIEFVLTEEYEEREIPEWAIEVCDECVASGGLAIVHINEKTGEVTAIECEPIPEEFQEIMKKGYDL